MQTQIQQCREKKTPTFFLNFGSKIEKTITQPGSDINRRNRILEAEAYEHCASEIQFVKLTNLKKNKKPKNASMEEKV